MSVESNRSVFLTKTRKGQVLTMPIAHSEGRYVCDEGTLKAMEDHDQIALRYTSNVNGSLSRIAGITNREGNVLGLMPHPDRCADKVLGSTDGALMFESLAAVL